MRKYTYFFIQKIIIDYKILIRYMISGEIGATIQFFSFYFLNKIIGIWYIYSVFLSFIAALCIVFLMQKLWTFRSFSKSLFKKEFFSYTIIAILGVLLNVFLMYIMVGLFDTNPILSQALAIIVIMPISFYFNKKITFAS